MGVWMFKDECIYHTVIKIVSSCIMVIVASNVFGAWPILESENLDI